MIPKRSLSFLALAALFFAVAAVPPAFAQSDVSAVMLVESDGNQQQMKISASGGNLRLDMQSPQGEASVVWTENTMLMIMHAQQMYMEFTQEMMERMRSMMGQMGNMPEAPDSVFDEDDVAQATFQVTGNTETINGRSAFEVQVTNPDGKQATLWMTEDSEVGMFEVMSRMADAFSNMALPGMQRDGAGGMAEMQRYMTLARAQGMPDGVVVRVVDPESGSVITLTEADTSALPASTFAAPDGYTKQAMPFQD